MRDIDTIVRSFREAGLKITPQRLSIFKFLQDNTDHPSAEKVYQEILKVHPSISFTTVYKTLQTLRDMGEIQELAIDPERVHYDPDTRAHVHTFCFACRKISDLAPGDSTDPDPAIPELPNNFELFRVQVHAVGLCGGCR